MPVTHAALIRWSNESGSRRAPPRWPPDCTVDWSRAESSSPRVDAPQDWPRSAAGWTIWPTSRPGSAPRTCSRRRRSTAGSWPGWACGPRVDTGSPAAILQWLERSRAATTRLPGGPAAGRSGAGRGARRAADGGRAGQGGATGRQTGPGRRSSGGGTPPPGPGPFVDGLRVRPGRPAAQPGRRPAAAGRATVRTPGWSHCFVGSGKVHALVITAASRASSRPRRAGGGRGLPATGCRATWICLPTSGSRPGWPGGRGVDGCVAGPAVRRVRAGAGGARVRVRC